MFRNLADCLTEHARSRPAHPAVIDRDRVITYAELERYVDEAVSNLIEAGVAPNDIVAISLPDCAEYLIILLALARCGAIIHAIDHTFPPAEKEAAAASAKVKAAIQLAGSALTPNARFVDAASICRPPREALHPPVL